MGLVDGFRQNHNEPVCDWIVRGRCRRLRPSGGSSTSLPKSSLVAVAADTDGAGSSTGYLEEGFPTQENERATDRREWDWGDDSETDIKPSALR